MSVDNIVAVVMNFLNSFGNYSNTIIAIVNIILVILIFLQLRDSRKPIITTKIISGNKEVTDRSDILESGKLYIVINNESKNIAKSLEIKYRFNFDNSSKKVKQDILSHLNPEEATEILLKTKSIIAKYPDIFEKMVEDNLTKTIPKKTLKIDLIITVRYNPIFTNLFKYKIEDNYVIEWGSLESYPNFEDHPVFNCWNKRNDDFYIYKTGKAIQEVKITREHFIDFCDFDISEVVFLCKVECPPIVIVLENVPDGERGISKDAEEKCDEAYFG
ncbi:MAG: hypothetical protein C4B59_08190 [Candidatus Methanogaster sp.]|uniref:Uncharacterized protein n=1 Tax=Candidatus Methanogaster sp. TaxID=3386292 RepID=A0AC61L2J2_9EURY|nr:MAG: hypothetical protein C4B59_08190 [ANME-2 cluster archaeon]